MSETIFTFTKQEGRMGSIVYIDSICQSNDAFNMKLFRQVGTASVGL